MAGTSTGTAPPLATGSGPNEPLGAPDASIGDQFEMRIGSVLTVSNEPSALKRTPNCANVAAVGSTAKGSGSPTFCPSICTYILQVLAALMLVDSLTKNISKTWADPKESYTVTEVASLYVA